jgi:hypothetical protein
MCFVKIKYKFLDAFGSEREPSLSGKQELNDYVKYEK